MNQNIFEILCYEKEQERKRKKKIEDYSTEDIYGHFYEKTSESECYFSAKEMIKWKDEQFKKFLSLLVIKAFDTRGKKNASETLLNVIFPMIGLDRIESSLEALMNEYETFKEKGTIL